MKFNPYIFSLLLINLSACTYRSVQYSYTSHEHHRESGREIESSPNTCFGNPSIKILAGACLPEEPIASPADHTTTVESKITKSKRERYRLSEVKEKPALDLKRLNLVKPSITPPQDEVPPRFNKDNVFWKIGRTLIKAGGGSFAVFGSLFLSLAVNRNGNYFFLSGIVVSLGLVLLSIPFFLLGIVVELMKRNAGPPIENPNEI